MEKIAKKSTIFILITALVFIPFATSALAETKTDKEDIDGATMAADIVFARPIGLIATVVGTALLKGLPGLDHIRNTSHGHQ